MPFKSEKQRRYLYATKPELAKKWSKKYGKKHKKKCKKKALFDELEQAVASLEKGSSDHPAFTGDSRAATDLRLRLLRDPHLSKADRARLLGLLEERPKGSRRTVGSPQLGANMTPEAKSLVAAYVDHQGTPVSPFLRSILKLGLLASKPLFGGLRVIDPRDTDEAPTNKWKRGFF